jgi:hypothetical protein
LINFTLKLSCLNGVSNHAEIRRLDEDVGVFIYDIGRGVLSPQDDNQFIPPLTPSAK